MKLAQDQAEYVDRMKCNPDRIIPAESMRFWLAMLGHAKPSVLLEHGCGWSSVVLSKWRESHIPHVIVEKVPQWRAAVERQLGHRFALWLTINEAVRVVPALRWAALIDGDKHGRAEMVKALLPYADKGIMLLDDANADYVKTAAQPLKNAPGKLWDLKPITFKRRKKDTWCWLWVGANVEMGSGETLLDGCEAVTW